MSHPARFRLPENKISDFKVFCQRSVNGIPSSRPWPRGNKLYNLFARSLGFPNSNSLFADSRTFGNPDQSENEWFTFVVMLVDNFPNITGANQRRCRDAFLKEIPVLAGGLIKGLSGEPQISGAGWISGSGTGFAVSDAPPSQKDLNLPAPIDAKGSYDCIFREPVADVDFQEILNQNKTIYVDLDALNAGGFGSSPFSKQINGMINEQQEQIRIEREQLQKKLDSHQGGNGGDSSFLLESLCHHPIKDEFVDGKSVQSRCLVCSKLFEPVPLVNTKKIDFDDYLPIYDLVITLRHKRIDMPGFCTPEQILEIAREAGISSNGFTQISTSALIEEVRSNINAWIKGYETRMNGGSLAANPYDLDADDYKAWVDGYNGEL